MVLSDYYVTCCRRPIAASNAGRQRRCERASDGEDGPATTIGLNSILPTPGRHSGVLSRRINGGHRDKVLAANTASRWRRAQAPAARRPPPAARFPFTASRAASPTVITRTEDWVCNTCRYLLGSVKSVRRVGCVESAQVVSAVGSCVVLPRLCRICPKLDFGQNTSHMSELNGAFQICEEQTMLPRQSIIYGDRGFLLAPSSATSAP